MPSYYYPNNERLHDQPEIIRPVSADFYLVTYPVEEAKQAYADGTINAKQMEKRVHFMLFIVNECETCDMSEFGFCTDHAIQWYELLRRERTG